MMQTMARLPFSSRSREEWIETVDIDIVSQGAPTLSPLVRERSGLKRRAMDRDENEKSFLLSFARGVD